MITREKEEREAHPARPIRSFFYTVWMLVSVFAFVAFFVALDVTTLPYRIPVLAVSAVLSLLTLVCGIITPMLRR